MHTSSTSTVLEGRKKLMSESGNQEEQVRKGLGGPASAGFPHGDCGGLDRDTGAGARPRMAGGRAKESIDTATPGSIVPRSDVRPLDVLMGRGNFHHPGNARFLRIVSERKAEYVSASTNAEKDRIATEVMERVADVAFRSGIEDGFEEYYDDNNVKGDEMKLTGRFLVPIEEDDSGTLCRILDEKTLAAKVKMNLRQKPRSRKSTCTRKEGEGAGAAPAKKGAQVYSTKEIDAKTVCSDRNKAKSKGKRQVDATADKEEDDSNQLTNLLADSLLLESSVDGETNLWGEGGDGILFQDFGDLDDLEQDLRGARACEVSNNNADSGATAIAAASSDFDDGGIHRATGIGHGTIVEGKTFGEICGVSSDNQYQRVLQNVRFALNRAQMVIAEHKAAEMAKEPGWEATLPNSLNALGRELFIFLTGIEPLALLSESDAIASAANDGFLPNQKPKKRTVHAVVMNDGTPSPSLSASTSPGLSMSLSDKLRDAGVPVSFSTVVKSLLDATDSNALERYRTAAEVEADLDRMVSNPDRYLFDPPLDQHHGKLCFVPNRLYGRTKEWEQVKSAFDKIIVTQEETHGYLLISGPPGSGKTALVQKLKDSLAELRGMIVWVKFDSQQQENPMTNICRGLDEYFQRLFQRDIHLSSEIGNALKESLGPTVVVLKDLIPTLGIIMGGWTTSNTETEGRETYNLILHCLKTVVNAIAQPSHPVIVLFDDLQWSDAVSQEIIRMLVTDEASRAAMFIGCYRDNEVDANHPVAENVGAILMSLVPLATVRLDNLDKDSVNDLCSDVLHLSPRLTRPLADALHSKTSGNPMFLRQLIKSLSDEGLLQYSGSERRWRWDITAIRNKAVADATVDLLIDMMNSYGAEVRWILQVASCLGFRVEEASLVGLASAAQDIFPRRDDIFIHIDVAMADGLLLRDGADTYRFSHDQIWMAAYSLMSEKEREAMHLQIGRKLHEELEQGEDADLSFSTIVDQYNRGIASVANHAEELEIAELNLKAGEKALSALLFQPASTYFCAGLSLLTADDWDTDYTLCARLYSGSAEVQLAQGSNEDALSSNAKVLANAKTTEDRIKAHEIQILANVAQAKFQDAIRESSVILSEFGIDISNINRASIQAEVVKAQSLFESSDITGQKLIQSLMSKPTSTESRQIGLMRILCFSSRAAYAASPPLMLYIILKMVQNVILNEEITAESSYAFGALSVAFCGLGFRQEAHLASKVALALLERFGGKYYNIVVCLVVSGSMPYRQPAQACIDLLRQSYRGACSVGDRDWARMSINQISQMSITAPERGKSLADAEKEIRQMLTEFPTEEEDSRSLFILAMQYLQLLLNLKEVTSTSMATSIDPTVLTGSALNQEYYLQICQDKGARDYFRYFYTSRLYLGYLFRRRDVSEQMANALEEIVAQGKFCSSFEMIVETFYMGLVAADILQRQMASDATADTNRWQKMTMDSLHSLTKWADEGSEWNFQHKADLLRAEIAVANGDAATAISSYQSAILGAGKSCHINEEALSCERAGLFFVGRGEIEEGRIYLLRSETLYNEWGAHRKAQDVSSLIMEHCS